MRWQVQEAKQRFSELLRAAASGEPQIVTRHGEEIAVVLDISEYRRLTGGRMSLLGYLLQRPEVGIDFDIERSRELPRDIDWSDYR